MAFIVPTITSAITRNVTSSIQARPTNFIPSTRFFTLTRPVQRSRQLTTLSLTSQEGLQTTRPEAAMSYMRADLDHIALDCKGPALDLVDFYVSVFNFEPYRVNAYKEGKAPFPSVRASPNTILDFFESSDEDDAKPPKGLRQSNHFCFAVAKADWDQLRERLAEKNVETMGEPANRSGARGDGVSIYVKDPEGNVVEFRYYPDDAAPEQD